MEEKAVKAVCGDDEKLTGQDRFERSFAGHDESWGGGAGCLVSAISTWVASDSSAQMRNTEEAGVAGCPSGETMRREAVII